MHLEKNANTWQGIVAILKCKVFIICLKVIITQAEENLKCTSP